MASTEGITDRKRAQAALEQAANRLELVTRATQDAVFDWDRVAHEVWCNENYQRLFGAPEMSPESANWWVERLHPEDLERIVKARNAAMEPEGKPFSAEYRLRRPDGSYADVVERSLVVRDAQGQPLRMIGALTDVTELRGAEKALKAYLALRDHPLARTHDLERLLDLASRLEPAFARLEGASEVLNPYATAFRYPSLLETPDPALA